MFKKENLNPIFPLKPFHRYYRWMLSQAADTAGAVFKASNYLIFLNIIENISENFIFPLKP
jgi:hypothetical protein